MVEFSIAAMAVLLILFGILEFARVLYIYHTVSNAARLASRWAIVRGSGCTVLDHCNAQPSDVQSYVQSIVPIPDSSNTTLPGCSNPGLCVVTTWSSTAGPSASCDQSSPSGNNAQGHLVCVTVQYPFNFAVPLVFSNGVTLSSSSQMVIAN
jgi:Flp pilus assembly protein TadG